MLILDGKTQNLKWMMIRVFFAYILSSHTQYFVLFITNFGNFYVCFDCVGDVQAEKSKSEQRRVDRSQRKQFWAEQDVMSQHGEFMSQHEEIPAKFQRPTCRNKTKSCRSMIRQCKEGKFKSCRSMTNCHTPNPGCDRPEANINPCLRSLAYQLLIKNPA